MTTLQDIIIICVTIVFYLVLHIFDDIVSLTKKIIVSLINGVIISFLLANVVLFPGHSLIVLMDLKNLLFGFHFLDFIAQIAAIFFISLVFAYIFILLPVIMIYLFYCFLTGKLNDDEVS